MKYCVNCGTAIEGNMKFCPECGLPLKEKTVLKTEREHEYVGKIMKCPNCGETINGFVGTCPSCGYVLQGITASDAAREFFDKLEKTSAEDEKVMLIRNFPIPNSKVDLFEFMVLSEANIEDSLSTKIMEAWVAKLELIYQKAKLVYDGDSNFENIQEIYDRTKKKITKIKRKKGLRHAGQIMSSGNTGIKKSAVTLFPNLGVIVAMVFFIMAIITDKSGGNSSGEELIGIILLIASACTLRKRHAGMASFIITGVGGVLSVVFAQLLENGSMLQLGGIIALIAVAVNFHKMTSANNEEEEE